MVIHYRYYSYYEPYSYYYKYWEPYSSYQQNSGFFPGNYVKLDDRLGLLPCYASQWPQNASRAGPISRFDLDSTEKQDAKDVFVEVVFAKWQPFIRVRQ